jgi:hypothetical protein
VSATCRVVNGGWRLVGIDRPDHQMAMATANASGAFYVQINPDQIEEGRFSVSRHVVRVFNAQGGEGRDGEASGACRRQTAEVTSSSNGLSSVAEKRFDASEDIKPEIICRFLGKGKPAPVSVLEKLLRRSAD